MSIPSESRGRQKGERQRCRSCIFCPNGGCGWDIAEYVMYCHLCGALSETCNTEGVIMPCAYARLFFFTKGAQSSYLILFFKRFLKGEGL